MYLSYGIESSFDKDQGKRDWFSSGKTADPNYRVPEQKETIGHKKRSTAVLQPLLTLNLIL